MTDFAHFPRPGENYPYVHCGSYVHVMAELVCYQLYSVFVCVSVYCSFSPGRGK